MGTKEVTQPERAFYARRGSTTGDLLTILHLPYTVWHLSYVVIGAALASDLDWLRLAGTLVAFAAGLGVAAHALDEVHDRPLATTLSDRALWALGAGGLVVAAGVAMAGAFVISPWVLAWAAGGVALTFAYALEWSDLIHSDIGFGLAWGAFPVLVGYWAQTEAVSGQALLAAGLATALSLVQRSLSSATKTIRRRSAPMDPENVRLLATWEKPLRILSVAVPLLALTLLAAHI